MRIAMIATVLLCAMPAIAQPLDAATAFGMRESVESASLSPDGTHLIYATPITGQGSALYIVPLDVPNAVPKRIANVLGKPEQLAGCRWATNARLLCTLYAINQLAEGPLATVTRIVAMDSDGGNVKLLRHNTGTGEQLGYALFGGSVIDWNAGESEVLMLRQYVPETTTGTRLAQTADGIGVDAINVMTLRSRRVEPADPQNGEYITDGKGTVRIKGRHIARDGFTTGTRRYYYRPKNGGNWQPLSIVVDDDGFDPYGVDPAEDIAYGLKKLNGRVAAYRKTLDGVGTETLVFAHDNVDVTGFARIGRNGRIVGATYTTDVRSVAYFDPVVATMVKALSKALPKLPLIRVIDSSEDEKRMLIWAGSDVDPGRYFLFDRTARKLDELALARPHLEGMTLAAVRHVSYPAADGTMVPAYLTLPAGSEGKRLPAIVLPHGGPSARDEWGFDWLSQYYVSQGFAVLQPNFRGSSGYGDAWLVKNGFQSWRVAVGDVNDAGRWLISQGIADPARLSIVGWSYGGYAALQSAVIEPDLFKHVVAIAPVTDLERLKSDRAMFSNAQEVARFVGSGPHVAQGSPLGQAAAIKAPVLLFHGDMDRNVSVTHSEMMQRNLKSAGKASEFVLYKGLDHYLEDSEARADMLRKSAAFLKMP